MLLIPCCIHENYFLNNQGNTNLLFEIPCKRFWKNLVRCKSFQTSIKSFNYKGFQLPPLKTFLSRETRKKFSYSVQLFFKIIPFSWKNINCIKIKIDTNWVSYLMYLRLIQKFKVELKSYKITNDRNYVDEIFYLQISWLLMRLNLEHACINFYH